ncbi:lytic transglycosylase domain-containing protein [Proteiniphilum acetatigenes]|uniref:lytic transglycosylase domain-containing protein n=1 Tax=Proteiniphilum acetatigenes TaxID=294710 RepID=UPI0003700FAB|nr:lytic transglycosylase domain-containing protein [Proteiniphilum acetatigenes]SFK28582.1 membrane-bound lytic murein transglycosylase D [Porphyromonadaceae bacterium KH3CP3RA]
MKRTILIGLITIWTVLGLIAQNTPPENSPETLSTSADTIQDNAIVYPESMTEKLSDLLRNWQLDLSNAEIDCKRGQNVVFHDSVYIKKLHNLPSEMELSFNSVVKNYIEMYAVRKREQVSYMLALGDYYFPMFEQALDRHGLPLELKYLPVIESALNPVAVSRVGATGLWQFMLRTGKGYGLEVNSLVDERRDPYKSTDAAVRYLKDLYAIYRDWNLVIAAYNCGPGNVNKAIARSGGKRDYWEIYYRLPRETRGYVPAFIAANYIMNYYADHNICPAHSSSLTAALDTVQVNERIHLEQIAGVLDIPLGELQRLNPQFKRDVIPGDFRAHALVLPTEKMYAFIDKNDTIINYDKERYFTHRANTDGFLDGSVSSVSGNTTNVYYRVKKGDNLSTIARRHGTTVDLIKSWNGLRSNKINIGKQLVVGKKAVAPQATTEKQLAQAVTDNPDGKIQTVNQYYRVRKGDTLGDIARKNGIQVAQLQSWNGLNSSRIGIGDQLIVGKQVVPAPQEPESEKGDYNRAETAAGGGNIISSYLRDQIEKVEQNKGPDEQETASEVEAEISMESEEESTETTTSSP